jgi:predicted nucleic acid-binding protein
MMPTNLIPFPPLRFKSDPWTERVRKWLKRRKDVSVAEVLKGALKIDERDQNHGAVIRVVNVLTALGFTQHRPRRKGGGRRGGDRPTRYWRPSSLN